jgi:hypothetical protein
MNTIYGATKMGAINTLDMQRNTKGTFAHNSLVNITDLAFTGDRMLFSGPDYIYQLHSDFLSTAEKERPSVPRYAYLTQTANPLQSATNVNKVDDETFLLWSCDDKPGVLTFFNPLTEQLSGRSIEFETPLISINLTPESKILTLENSGTCKLIDLYSLEQEFNYSAFGLQTAIYANRFIIAGKSRTSGFNAPMLQINPKTGETVPVYDNNVLTYKLFYDNENEKLYSLGLVEKGDSFNTVLKEHSGKNFELGFTIFSYKGEDLGANMLKDTRNNRIIYTTLGYEGIGKFSSFKYTLFKQKKHIARKIYIDNNYLYALNDDSSITVWDKANEERILDLYFFEDRNWIAQLPTGHFYGSVGCPKHIGFYIHSIPYSGNTDNFNLRKNEAATRAWDFSAPLR